MDVCARPVRWDPILINNDEEFVMADKTAGASDRVVGYPDTSLPRALQRRRARSPMLWLSPSKPNSGARVRPDSRSCR